MQLIVYTDGACSGNPGPMGAGAVLVAGERILTTISQPLGSGTNNIAEYKAVILGLQKAHEIGATNIILRSDSQLVIRQLQGVYQVKNAGLLPLYTQAKGLLAKFQSYKLEHIKRHLNTLADNAANQAVFQTMLPLE